ncbi:hypothetical protein LCGC14_2076650, partial [marine sediment metagenome]
ISAFNFLPPTTLPLMIRKNLCRHRLRLLLLDELSLGLAPQAVRELFRLIRTLQQQGMTILLVEQNVRQALTISNRGYVLESGRVVLSGDAHALLSDGLVVQSYLGVKRGSTPDSQGGSK